MNTNVNLPGFIAVLGEHASLAFFLELALKSSILIACTLLLALLLRRSAAAYRHLLWSLCILTLSCLPVFVGVVPKLELTVKETATVVVPQQALAASPAATNLHSTIENGWQPALQVYLAGLLLLILYTACGLVRIVLLNAQAVPSRNTHALQLLADLLAEELSDLRVSLREHPALVSPLSWGLLKPVIIVPVGSQQWSAGKMRHVLLHELNHIQRLDWITQLAGRYVCAVYWYNPLVWLAARNMNELAEQACDDAVLLNGSSHTAYASDLVSVARASLPTGRMQHLAQALATSFLGSRIIAILDTARMRRHNDSVWVIRGVLAAFCCVALLASLSLAPTAQLASLRANFSRYITINVLPERAASARSLPLPQELPRRLVVSTNLPELESIYIQRPRQNSLDADNNAGTSAAIKLPVIAYQEVAGTTPMNNLQQLQILQKRFPVYPAAAQSKGIEGYTTIEFDLTAEGRVINPVVIESRPARMFDQNSLAAISEYLYQPPQLNGKAIGIKGLRTRFIYQLIPEPE